MASHGVPRVTGEQPISGQARKKELQKIQEYKELVDIVDTKVQERQYTREVLQLTSKLLTLNPEYYTIWNYRRLILRHQFTLSDTLPSDNAESNDAYDTASQLITTDLAFLIPLLRKFPKCYWIWNYRLWLLEEATRLLQESEVCRLWNEELGLVGKMLSLDSRNFLGWGYRRTVIAALERSRLNPNATSQNMTEDEFKYTTRMIGSNLSNFSAWHNRSKLIPRLLKERDADNVARKKFLDEELELIHTALYTDASDQSLWFYHQNLMCNFDRKHTHESMAPNLTADEERTYITEELDYLLDMLDGALDCKWIYQSLVQLSSMYEVAFGQRAVQATDIEDWIGKLIELDPLRRRRWNDLSRDIGSGSTFSAHSS